MKFSINAPNYVLLQILKYTSYDFKNKSVQKLIGIKENSEMKMAMKSLSGNLYFENYITKHCIFSTKATVRVDMTNNDFHILENRQNLIGYQSLNFLLSMCVMNQTN